MTIRRLSRRSRLVTGALTLLMAVSMSSGAHAASDCAGSDRSPDHIGAAAVRATTLCLLNVERRNVGLPELREDARLARAARRHSRDMVAHRYFAHDSRSGSSFSARIARTGWMRGRGRWFVGENLAWGSQSHSTPRAVVAAWMASPSHRQNIVQRRFRVIGIGVVKGVPFVPVDVSATLVPADVGATFVPADLGATFVPADVGATYTTDFGS